MSESSRGAEIVDSVVPDCRWDWWVKARAELIRLFDEALDEVYQSGCSDQTEAMTSSKTGYGEDEW